MSETISKREAAQLLGISIRELNRRVKAGDLQSRPSATRLHRGKPITEILVSSLPAETQAAWMERPCLTNSPELAAMECSSIQTLQVVPPLSNPLHPGACALESQISNLKSQGPVLEAERGSVLQPARRSGLQPARRELLIGTGASEPQMVLDFDRKDAFRLLDPDLRAWAWTWFERLVDAGLLCLVSNDRVLRNGGWKRFRGQELRAGGRCFYIYTKEDVVEYVAATFEVSPAFVWERCREFQEFFTYVVSQKCSQQPVDLDFVAQIFPVRAKDSGGRFRPRADAGISKTIPQAAAEFLLARYGAGSRPGKDGWRPSLALVLNEYETLRQAIIQAGENPDQHGYPEVSIYALRRLLPKAARESDPGLVLAREGSAALRDRVTPYIPRDKSNLFAHDWWVSDHRQSNLWVRWSRDRTVIYRPWTTWLVDVRTQYPIAFVLAPVPSSLTIFRALKVGFFTFETAPSVFYCDNGKDYKALLLGSREIPMESNDGFDTRQQGLLDRFQIAHKHTLPSRRDKSTGETECHARSKPIEAWFGQWLNPFDSQQPGACGKDPSDKPDKLYVELARANDVGAVREPPLLLDLEYERRLAAYVNDRIANHPSRGLKGLTPAQALERYSRAAWGLEERHLLAEQIGELALVRDHRKVANSMVTVKIGGEERKYEHSAFFSLSGQDVDIAYDPTEPAEIFVYYNGRALGRAVEVPKQPWGSEISNLKPQISEGMRKQRLATKSARQTIVRREQAAGWLPDQGEMTAIRELMVQRRILPAHVAHAASIERVREPSARRAERRSATGRMPSGPTRMPSAAELVRAAIAEEEKR
jgi:hypothetical protein